MRKSIVLALLSFAGVSAQALPVVLINCASADFQSQLTFVREGGEAAGVMVADATEARARVDQIVRTGMDGLVGSNGQVAVVKVIKILNTRSESGVTCLTFTGVHTYEPVPEPGTWVSGRGTPQPPRRPADTKTK